MPGLLDKLPKPLLQDLVSGRWLPIVGAGLSRNAVVPGTPGEGLPDWVGLARSVAQDLPHGYAQDSPVEIISAYEHAFGRARLIARVGEALKLGRAVPGAMHEAFSRIPFETVVTTNVEQILDTAYRNRHGGLMSVIEQSQLRLTNPYAAPTLVKLHGDLHHPASLVLTEGDYDSFIDSNPLLVTWLANQLISKTGVLIGYSLDDADFRQVLAMLRSRLGPVPPSMYVLSVGATTQTVQRYERRGVKVISLPKGQGYSIFVDLFEEIADYWENHTRREVTGITASVRALLNAGTTVESSVLFLVPQERLSVYDEFVFPRLAEAGLIPFTLHDVTQPSGYRVASLDALLAVAGHAIVEAQGASDPNFLRAVRALGSGRVIRLTSESSFEPDGMTIATPSDPGGWEYYSEELLRYLRTNAPFPPGNPPEKSHRERAPSLRQRVLKGLIDMERDLREELKYQEMGPRKEQTFFWSLLDNSPSIRAREVPQAELRRLADIRNSLVHGQVDDGDPRIGWAWKLLNRLGYSGE